MAFGITTIVHRNVSRPQGSYLRRCFDRAALCCRQNLKQLSSDQILWHNKSPAKRAMTTISLELLRYNPSPSVFLLPLLPLQLLVPLLLLPPLFIFWYQNPKPSTQYLKLPETFESNHKIIQALHSQTTNIFYISLCVFHVCYPSWVKFGIKKTYI